MLEDYKVAASYLSQLAPFYAKDDWSDVELLTLELYAQCLHRVEQNADYVRIGMKTLAKRIRGNAATRQIPHNKSMKLPNIRQPAQSPTGSLSDFLNASKLLQEQIILPMDSFFDRVNMGIYISHSPDNDGFQFPLVLSSLLPESFLAESVRVQILGVQEDQRSELWLQANSQNIEPGMSRIWLGAKVSWLCFHPNATITYNENRRCSQPGIH